MPAAVRAEFPLPFSLDLAVTLGHLKRGASDPTIRLESEQAWRAARTPDGPGALHLKLEDRAVTAEAWGMGAGWLIEHVPALLGFDDDPGSFHPRSRLLRELHRRHSGLRLGRTGLVFEALVPTILEQKVPGVEAWASYSRLVRRLGERAPGAEVLMVQPSPARLLSTPYWTAHRIGIERRRFATIQRAAAVASRLESVSRLTAPRALGALMSLPGVGAWSAAEVAASALGDRDVVSLGDYHLPHQVSWALAGEPRGTDRRMLDLLEPYRGHRARVIRLLTIGGIQAPRFGPRMRLRRIAAI
jgi:3-methyladenine DNA glycosylase/8-oxoguanine DNA glycosylase